VVRSIGRQIDWLTDRSITVSTSNAKFIRNTARRKLNGWQCIRNVFELSYHHNTIKYHYTTTISISWQYFNVRMNFSQIQIHKWGLEIRMCKQVLCTRCPEKSATLFLPLTMLNVNQFSNNDVIVIFFAYKNIFTVATLKNPQNDRLYAYPSNKKKDVMTY